jgi:hypothetical protein
MRGKSQASSSPLGHARGVTEKAVAARRGGGLNCMLSFRFYTFLDGGMWTEAAVAYFNQKFYVFNPKP